MSLYVIMNSDSREGVIHQDNPPRVIGRIYNVAPLTGNFELYAKQGDLEEPFVNLDGTLSLTVRYTANSVPFHPAGHDLSAPAAPRRRTRLQPNPPAEDSDG